jgi:hypothetical protein
MQYLFLMVDLFGIPLRVEGEPARRSWPVTLSDQLKKDVIEWNERFGPLIAAEHLYSAEDRRSQCAALNEEGRQLANRIAAEVSGGAKVRYVPEEL